MFDSVGESVGNAISKAAELVGLVSPDIRTRDEILAKRRQLLDAPPPAPTKKEVREAEERADEERKRAELQVRDVKLHGYERQLLELGVPENLARLQADVRERVGELSERYEYVRSDQGGLARRTAIYRPTARSVQFSARPVAAETDATWVHRVVTAIQTARKEALTSMRYLPSAELEERIAHHRAAIDEAIRAPRWEPFDPKDLWLTRSTPGVSWSYEDRPETW